MNAVRLMAIAIVLIFTLSVPRLYGQDYRSDSRSGEMAGTDTRLSVFSHNPSEHARLLAAEEMMRLDLILQAGLVRYRLDRRGSDRLSSIPDELPEGLARDAVTGELIYPVIIHTDSPGALGAAGIEVNTVMPGFVTARVREHQLELLAGSEYVESATAGDLQYPLMDQSLYETRAHLLHAGYLNQTRFAGKDAIVVVFDTGVDWQHPNFLDPDDPGRSRILYLWDVTLEPQNGETTPGGSLDYGVEYSRSQIEAALLNPDLVRSRDTNGHGTHVLGSAAASGQYYKGVAPDADIIVVRGGVNSFSLANIINGLEYARIKASELGKPVVVNMSLGGRVGPRDGSRSDEVAIDVLSQNPGYVVVTSAGNDGARALHRTGTFGGGASASMVIQVPVYTPRQGTSNDQFILDIWMDTTMPVTATLHSPTGKVFDAPGGTNTTFGDQADGAVYMFNGQSNGKTNVYARVYDATEGSEPRTGEWTLWLTSPVAGIRYDGWLASFSVGSAIASLQNGSTDYSVTMPATAASAITVAAYTVNRNFVNSAGTSLSFTAAIDGEIASFSSKGPTRDGRQKPEIAAPGYVIRASLSGDENFTENVLMPGSRHIIKSGTSMAAPHVAGAVAVLLGANPSLTAAGAKELLRNSASKDAFTGPDNGNTWGAGKMNLLDAMKQMLNINTDTATEILRYHGTFTSPTTTSPLLDASSRYAVRFRPGLTGDVTGFQLYLWTIGPGNGRLFAEIYTNSSGEPGTMLGQRVEVPVNDLTPALYNYIDLSGSGARVQANTEYYVVFGVEGTGTIGLAIDNGDVIHGRSMVNSAGNWQFMTDANSNIREIAAKVEITSGLLDGSAVPIPDEMEIPRFVELEQNYPNPFNPATTIVYTVPHQTEVTLSVYDLLGRRVALLVNEPRQQGTYAVNWDASGAASGVYIYRIEAAGQSLTRKMTLLR
jgi:minor extracellular serine protease Vpr